MDLKKMGTIRHMASKVSRRSGSQRPSRESPISGDEEHDTGNDVRAVQACLCRQASCPY